MGNHRRSQDQWALSSALSGPVLLLRGLDVARDAEAAREAVPASLVLRALDGWFRDEGARRVLLDLYARGLGASAGAGYALSPLDLQRRVRERVERALHSGEVVALRSPSARNPPLSYVQLEERQDHAEDDSREHWVEFQVEYADGSPAKGLGYTLTEPGGAEKEGSLGGDGSVEKRPAKPGTYTLALKDVEYVGWQEVRTRCDREVEVLARVSGFAEGTSGKLRVYREFAEAEDQALDTLDVTVRNERVEAKWKYDYAKTAERKAERGVRNFVAEVSFEGGKYWGKTLVPLEVELKSVVFLRWVSAHASDGGSAHWEAETRGFESGVEAKLELWSHDWHGEDRKVKDLPAPKIRNGRVTGSVSYRDGGGGSGGADITRAGEYFLVMTVDDKVKRTARSHLLWAVPGEGGGAGEGGGGEGGERAGENAA